MDKLTAITQLNSQSAKQAELLFMQCCTSTLWVKQMVLTMPFVDQNDLIHRADEAWSGLSEKDYLEAFEGHPKIGDVNSLRAKYANTKVLASGEQGAVNQATDEVLEGLTQFNKDYEAKFGFIIIVCATGKSALQMLDLLKARFPNNRDIELKNAAEEQRKIFQIRITKMLESLHE